jgi:hypothetical protein
LLDEWWYLEIWDIKLDPDVSEGAKESSDCAAESAEDAVSASEAT